MSLSKNSNDHIQFLYDNFYDDGYNEVNLDINHKIYKNFLKYFKEAEEFIKELKLKIKVLRYIAKPDDYDYILPIFQNFIEDNIKKTNFYTFQLKHHTINIFIMEEKVVPTDVIVDYIKDIIFWLHVVTQFPNQNCSNKLNIFIYLTSLTKTLPEKDTEIKKEHINTGYTTSCVLESNIVIYRKEEWFKVFIHETIHNLGLDFSLSYNNDITNKILSIFPVKSHVKLYEAYTDSWARVINCLIISFKSNGTNEEEYLLVADCLIDIERVFSVCQTVKLLNFMGLKYTDLFSDDMMIKAKYIENTSVLSYYIITAVLYDNISHFFSWCLENNVNMLQFNNSDIKYHMSFCELIKKLYKTPKFLERVKHKEKIFENIDDKLHFTQITIKSICSLH